MYGRRIIQHGLDVVNVQQFQVLMYNFWVSEISNRIAYATKNEAQHG